MHNMSLWRRVTGATDAEIIQGDTTDEASLTGAMAGCDGVVLCTSAVPKILPFSIAKLLFKKTILRSKEPGRPKYVAGSGMCTVAVAALAVHTQRFFLRLFTKGSSSPRVARPRRSTGWGPRSRSTQPRRRA